MDPTGVAWPGRQSLLAFALAGCVAAGPAFAKTGDAALSQLGIERWTPEAGLAGSWVTDIAADRTGFLWIATSGGLSRFDGRTFRNFTAATETDLPSSAMNAVAVDGDGLVWVGLEHGGVRALEGDGLRPRPGLAGLPDVTVRSLAAGERGTLWIGTTMGLWRAGPGGLRFVALPGSARDADVRRVVVAPDGAAWARTRDHGLFRVEGEVVTLVPDVPDCVGLSLAFARDGHPVTSCVGGIWERRPGDTVWTRVSAAPNVHRLLVDGEGALWFESLEGLSRQSPGGRTEVLPAEGGVGDVRIRALFEDSRGGVWVGTFAAGLSRLRNGAVRTAGPNEGLPLGDVTAVAAGAGGSLWVGTHNHGLLHWDAAKGVLDRWTVRDGLPSDRILAVAPDPDRGGRVWLGTRGGLALLENGRARRIGRPGGGTSEEVSIVLADPGSAGTVWAGGPRGGLEELHADGSTFRHDEANGLAAGRVRALLRERSGALLAAGDGGVFRWDGTLWNELSLGPKTVRNVRALAEEADGTLWLASPASGLYRWSRGALALLSERDGLPSAQIYSLELDGAGGLWLSGEEGVVRLKVADFERWVRGEKEAVPAVRLSGRDGLRDRECNGWGRPASTHLPDGTLVFPTAGGIALVDTTRLPRPVLSPEEIYVDRAFTGARTLAPAGPWKLGADERDLRPRFGAVEFDLPESVLFRYRLEGLDARWVPAAVLRTANYSRVPPGRYRFRLQARLPGQEWVEARVVPEVLVAPTLPESSWFRALVAAVLLGAVATGVFWRFRVQARHAGEISASREELRRLASALLRAQEEERGRLARELHDDLTQRLAGLAMLTGGFAKSARRRSGLDLTPGLEEVGRELEKLAADSQSLSRELHPSLLANVGVDGALRAECATFGARTGLRVDYESRDVPGVLPAEVGIVLYRITQEALRNVLSHSGSAEARVSLVRDPAGLELTVDDSGKGFDPARRVPGRGLGLASMSERARLIGANLSIGPRPGGGTRVRVRVAPTSDEAAPRA